jgi:hypothetical protein
MAGLVTGPEQLREDEQQPCAECLLVWRVAGAAPVALEGVPAFLPALVSPARPIGASQMMLAALAAVRGLPAPLGLAALAVAHFA